jgi:hypothetical protein
MMRIWRNEEDHRRKEKGDEMTGERRKETY